MGRGMRGGILGREGLLELDGGRAVCYVGAGLCRLFFFIFYFGTVRSSIADLSPRSPLAGPVGREVGRTRAVIGKGHLGLIKSAFFWPSLGAALPFPLDFPPLCFWEGWRRGGEGLPESYFLCMYSI